MARISFGALPCRKRNLMTARVSILLNSLTSLTCFRACFLPGRAKDLSAPRYGKVTCSGKPHKQHALLFSYMKTFVQHWTLKIAKIEIVAKKIQLVKFSHYLLCTQQWLPCIFISETLRYLFILRSLSLLTIIMTFHIGKRQCNYARRMRMTIQL